MGVEYYYTLELRCDNPGCSSKESFSYYKNKNLQILMSKAREKGWIFKNANFCICPDCIKSGKRE